MLSSFALCMPLNEMLHYTLLCCVHLCSIITSAYISSVPRSNYKTAGLLVYVSNANGNSKEIYNYINIHNNLK